MRVDVFALMQHAPETGIKAAMQWALTSNASPHYQPE
jgi:hypothetical protein